jgi:hypothetical protein
LTEREIYRDRPEPLLKLTTPVLERNDLGSDTFYVQQEVLDALTSCNHPDVLKVATRLHTDDVALLQKQVELAYTKAGIDPDTAESFATPYLHHASRPLMRAAERAVDRAQEEKKSRQRSGR